MQYQFVQWYKVTEFNCNDKNGKQNFYYLHFLRSSVLGIAVLIPATLCIDKRAMRIYYRHINDKPLARFVQI